MTKSAHLLGWTILFYLLYSKLENDSVNKNSFSRYHIRTLKYDRIKDISSQSSKAVQASKQKYKFYHSLVSHVTSS